MVVGLPLIKPRKYKTDKKIYSLGGNGLKRYGKSKATNKQYKIGQRNTYYCAKKNAYSVTDLILSKSDFLEDIMKRIITDFSKKIVEQK